MGSWVALVAIYLLVAQALLGATAFGERASASAAGVLPSILCGSGQQQHGPLPAEQAPGKAHLPDCCTTACPMLGPLPPPVTTALDLPPRSASGLVAPFAADSPPGRSTAYSPGNPRAPPRMA
ncbi:DUF2946 domain-containing protein [Geminicoccus roseus]|uniref:DUF2946 domain-containing protein n=1 Tax=Geminicoccus roseus TaxID=404900 RepID=UPI0004075CD2|nr:DUF2946 domain-containing protein [Geminicoccus roseus]